VHRFSSLSEQTRWSTARPISDPRIVTQVGSLTSYPSEGRPACARASRDAELVEAIRPVHAERPKGRGVAGYRKEGIRCSAMVCGGPVHR